MVASAVPGGGGRGRRLGLARERRVRDDDVAAGGVAVGLEGAGGELARGVGAECGVDLVDPRDVRGRLGAGRTEEGRADRELAFGADEAARPGAGHRLGKGLDRHPGAAAVAGVDRIVRPERRVEFLAGEHPGVEGVSAGLLERRR